MFVLPSCRCQAQPVVRAGGHADRYLAAGAGATARDLDSVEPAFRCLVPEASTEDSRVVAAPPRPPPLQPRHGPPDAAIKRRRLPPANVSPKLTKQSSPPWQTRNQRAGSRLKPHEPGSRDPSPHPHRYYFTPRVNAVLGGSESREAVPALPRNNRDAYLTLSHVCKTAWGALHGID